MTKYLCFFLIFFISINFAEEQNTWIRINQLGYLTNSVKVAVLVSKEKISPDKYFIKDALTEQTVWESDIIKYFGRCLVIHIDFSS